VQTPILNFINMDLVVKEVKHKEAQAGLHDLSITPSFVAHCAEYF
jgi:hypothetical protein